MSGMTRLKTQKRAGSNHIMKGSRKNDRFREGTGWVPAGLCGHVIDSSCHPEYSGDYRCVLKGGIIIYSNSGFFDDILAACVKHRLKLGWEE